MAGVETMGITEHDFKVFLFGAVGGLISAFFLKKKNVRLALLDAVVGGVFAFFAIDAILNIIEIMVNGVFAFGRMFFNKADYVKFLSFLIGAFWEGLMHFARDSPKKTWPFFVEIINKKLGLKNKDPP